MVGWSQTVRCAPYADTTIAHHSTIRCARSTEVHDRSSVSSDTPMHPSIHRPSRAERNALLTGARCATGAAVHCIVAQPLQRRSAVRPQVLFQKALRAPLQSTTVSVQHTVHKQVVVWPYLVVVADHRDHRHFKKRRDERVAHLWASVSKTHKCITDSDAPDPNGKSQRG